MTFIRFKKRRSYTREPGDSSPEFKRAEDGSIPTQAQRGVTTPSQPGRKDRQDPAEEVPGDQDQVDDEDMPGLDPKRPDQGKTPRSHRLSCQHLQS